MYIRTIIEIIGIIIGLVGITSAILDRLRNRRISWRAVKKQVKEIAEKVKLDTWEPDVFLAFPKGGLIVADLLGHQFNNDMDIAAIFTKRTMSEHKEVKYHIRYPYCKLSALKDKRVLVVDDVLENGITMKRVIELLQDHQVPRESIRSAVLGRSTGVDPAIQPDYYAFDYEKSNDLYLPWGKVTL